MTTKTMARTKEKPHPALTYKQAGVNIDANTRWVGAIESAMRSTYGPRVPQDRHGGFAGLFRLDTNPKLFQRNYKRPVLVGCTDGVGTKILIAIEMNRLDTIGIDLVAMNVNDLITCGAEPLFFLDYLAVHKLDPDHLREVIEGIAVGCREAGCALLGGETAEMPDLYRKGDLDLAGFAVGVTELNHSINPTQVKVGDVVIGLPSSGIHSNGYTLVRKLIARAGCKLDQHHDKLGETLGQAVLRPTRIYVRPVLAVMDRYRARKAITGMAHITGGGLMENLNRALPAGCDAVLKRSSWPIPPIFPFLQRLGTTSREMYRVFNMGIGYVLIVRPAFADGVMKLLNQQGEQPVIIGRIERGTQRVRLR
jgi:phosphoribosylformylglycinamidine cyclo-ligase